MGSHCVTRFTYVQGDIPVPIGCQIEAYGETPQFSLCVFTPLENGERCVHEFLKHMFRQNWAEN